MRFIFTFVFVVSAVFAAAAQTPTCTGVWIFAERKCADDEQSPEERALFDLINQYREKNGLRPVPWSDALAALANRRMLDLTQNIKALSHGWSNCPYKLDDESTWPCVSEAPRRIKTGFDGAGHENLFRKSGGPATPAEALAAWQKSPHHNNLILNLEGWKNVELVGLGVAISGQYAAIWFGSAGESEVPLNSIEKGLGVEYARVIDGLSQTITLRRESTLGETQKWSGSSVDNEIRLELFGTPNDIAETNMSLVVKTGKGVKISVAGRAAARRFLKNLAPAWIGRDRWLDKALVALTADPASKQNGESDGRTFQLRLETDGSLRLDVRPSGRPRPIEL